MRITLSELKQFIKNVIKESVLAESNNPPMGGATDIFINNGYEVLKSNNEPEMSLIELKINKIILYKLCRNYYLLANKFLLKNHIIFEF